MHRRVIYIRKLFRNSAVIIYDGMKNSRRILLAILILVVKKDDSWWMLKKILVKNCFKKTYSQESKGI